MHPISHHQLATINNIVFCYHTLHVTVDQSPAEQFLNLTQSQKIYLCGSQHSPTQLEKKIFFLTTRNVSTFNFNST